ncbi:MAG: hypothetical protein IT449_13370 [Phycisphaerales bacterium]|nr:hypothetical protein [Phycisphaerales bacterium]
MRALTNALLPFALVLMPAGAQGPASLGENRGGGSIAVPPPLFQPEEETYNRLDIVDRQTYVYGNGDAWSGTAIFGYVSDLQAVDDVNMTDNCCVDSVVRDYLTFFGSVPAGGCYLAVYPHNGNGAPQETAECEEDGTQVHGASFEDTVFGLLGMRLTALSNTGCCFAAGIIFIDCQPHDETDGGDWYYAVRDNVLFGYDIHLRDGGRGQPGYGSYTWISSSRFGYGAGTISQAVSRWCCGLPAHCSYEVTLVQDLATLEGVTCGACPYIVGDRVCTDRCGYDGDCRGRLRGFSACADAGACRVVARLIGCESPPRECKFCGSLEPSRLCP